MVEVEWEEMDVEASQKAMDEFLNAPPSHRLPPTSVYRLRTGVILRIGFQPETVSISTYTSGRAATAKTSRAWFALVMCEDGTIVELNPTALRRRSERKQ